MQTINCVLLIYISYNHNLMKKTCLAKIAMRISKLTDFSESQTYFFKMLPLQYIKENNLATRTKKT